MSAESADHDLRPRVGVGYDGDTCPLCGYDGTHDRDTGRVDLPAAPQYGKWYDIVTCGGCAYTIKERGGLWDQYDGQLVNEDDLEWNYPHDN